MRRIPGLARPTPAVLLVLAACEARVEVRPTEPACTGYVRYALQAPCPESCEGEGAALRCEEAVVVPGVLTPEVGTCRVVCEGDQSWWSFDRIEAGFRGPLRCTVPGRGSFRVDVVDRRTRTDPRLEAAWLCGDPQTLPRVWGQGNAPVRAPAPR